MVIGHVSQTCLILPTWGAWGSQPFLWRFWVEGSAFCYAIQVHLIIRQSLHRSFWVCVNVFKQPTVQCWRFQNATLESPGWSFKPACKAFFGSNENLWEWASKHKHIRISPGDSSGQPFCELMIWCSLQPQHSVRIRKTCGKLQINKKKQHIDSILNQLSQNLWTGDVSHGIFPKFLDDFNVSLRLRREKKQV